MLFIFQHYRIKGRISIQLFIHVLTKPIKRNVTDGFDRFIRLIYFSLK